MAGNNEDLINENWSLLKKYEKRSKHSLTLRGEKCYRVWKRKGKLFVTRNILRGNRWNAFGCNANKNVLVKFVRFTYKFKENLSCLFYSGHWLYWIEYLPSCFFVLFHLTDVSINSLTQLNQIFGDKELLKLRIVFSGLLINFFFFYKIKLIL